MPPAPPIKPEPAATPNPYTWTVILRPSQSPEPNYSLHPAEAAARQRAVMLKIVRAAFFILIATFTTLAFLQHQEGFNEGVGTQWWLPLLVSVILFLGALGVDLLTPNKKTGTIVGVLVGVLAGLIATLALGFIIDLAVESWAVEEKAVAELKPTVNSIKIIIGITLSYLGVSTILQTQDDFRLVIPYVEFAKQLRGVRPILIDTSVLIDGRIADVAATGFMQAPVVIPRFVVGELQQLADSADAMRRSKGRRGLEIIAKLQRQPRLDVTIDDTLVPGKAVDQMVVELARSMSAMVATTDVGLARVANIHGVPVLNINDLANALKSALVPGEQVTIKLVRQGEQATQGVGYLADGTMVVAEDGAHAIGHTVTMTVTSSLQTSAGRLIFARINVADAMNDSQAPAIAEVPQPAPAAPASPTASEQPVAPEAPTPHAAANGAAESAPPPRTPFPPKPPRTLKSGTPRNPRR